MALTVLSRGVLIAPFCLALSRFVCYAKESEQQAESAVRIGVIGAGIGGSSCSFYLRQLFGKDAELDVYEAGEIGGRLATVSIGGHVYESGATVIHPKNMYMQRFVRDLGLKHKDRPTTGKKMGFYNGEEFVFIESQWSVVTLAKMFWKYGFDLLKLRKAVGVLIENFSRIYDVHDNGIAYTSVEGILNAMGGREYVNLTKVSLAEVLKEHGYADEFVADMVSIAARVNYGQQTNMSAFAGEVSLAGVQGGLWSVHGGNKQVCSRLLEKSKATLYKSTVSGIKLAKGDKPGYYLIIAEPPDKNGNISAHVAGKYDIIVIATPLHHGKTDLKFKSFPKEITNFPDPFHRTVATYVDGELNFRAFGFDSKEDCPTEILTTRDNKFGINSVAHNYPVDYQKGKTETQKPVWKVFSREPLTDNQLGTLFTSRKETKVVDWLAYPHYDPPDTLSSFELHAGLYYINSVEWAASAMEMVAVGGRNTALLAYNKYHGLNDKIDAKWKPKTEL
ncbi:prenylcysteine oxidase 1-like [Ptychodera flava]|uniref:prenylcysteine oxidase 1-like n=1 Tax=Ptychodera flava TaxID=63121 RepID=UPI003969EB2C